MRINKEYYFWKSPTKRQLSSGLPHLDNETIGLLKRFEWLVTRNAYSMEGDGHAFYANGKKMPAKDLILELARMGRDKTATVRDGLKKLAAVNEISLNPSGLPRLINFEEDCDREPNNKAVAKTKNNDVLIMPSARIALILYDKIAESRTRDELELKLGGLMIPNRQQRVAKRLVCWLEDEGSVVFSGNDIIHISGVKPSPPPAAPRPLEGTKEGDRPFLPAKEKILQEIETKEKEDTYVSPIESIELPPKPPLGDSWTGSHQKRGRGAAGGSNHAGQFVFRRLGSKTIKYDRSWSGTQYEGWTEGINPHPRRTKEELKEFKIEGLHNADLIDAMLYLAPDGTPLGHPKFVYGQEGTFQAMLKKLTKLAKGVENVDDPVRQVLAEFIDIRLNQKKDKDCDAAYLVEMLWDLVVQQGGERPRKKTGAVVT